MLETLDLSLKLSAEEAKPLLAGLGQQLGVLQRAVRAAGVPVLLLFEGWDDAGKGDSIGRLVEWLDPRGFRVHAPRRPSEDEALRPPGWRFWRRLPPRGAIAIFDRSWHSALLGARLGGELNDAAFERELERVRAFERQLADDGALLVKFWLHVSKKEQKRRLKDWARDPYQRWRAEETKEAPTGDYDQALPVVETLLARTHVAAAPWIPIEAEDDQYRRVRVLEETAGALRGALAARAAGQTAAAPGDERDAGARPGGAASDAAPDAGPPPEAAPAPHPDPLTGPVAIPTGSPLARVDLARRLSREEYRERLAAAQDLLREREFACYVRRQAVVIVFEGWDAAGKGGVIKRLTERLDPRGYDVIPVAAPAGDEAARHYLWRFWRDLPKAGHLAIFDRSWYGRVLVERVEGFAAEPAWRRAYEEINAFERELAAAGVALVKFWLHISPEEQLRRFRAREQDPAKRHKITPEDWRNRVKLPLYLEAVGDMLRWTSTPEAPWTVVEAEDKLHARVKVCETVAAALGRVLGEEEGRGGAGKGRKNGKERP